MLPFRFTLAAARALPPLMLAALLAAGPLAGQIIPARDTVARARPGAGAERVTTPPLLDRPVVRSEYRLGPGDVVSVAIFGEVELFNTLTVSPEGTLVVPSVGVVRVLGANLDEAEARVRNAVYRLYRNVDVTLSLNEVRTFKVFLLGDVPSPGVVAATSVTRASEVIPVNGARAAPAALPRHSADRAAGLALHRNILLRRAAGDSVLVDLARFTLLGDLSANPTLREGDALIVRAVTESVQVLGPVSFPGTYEYRAGESLASLLALATGGGGLPIYASDSVRIGRVSPGGGQRSTLVMSAADAMGPAGAALRMQPFDVVYLQYRTRFASQPAAVVQGQVANPGTYPIRPDTTTVRQLIMQAGGFTERASPVGATLRRVPVPGSRLLAGEELAPDSALTDAERDVRRLQAVSAEAANYVVVDVARIFAPGGEAYDIRLQPGDVLHVPEHRNDVAVIGAVARPGLVVYTPGLSVDQYANRAGGYLRRAAWKDATVLRASTGARLSAREAGSVQPGDRIVVPFRERRTFAERLLTVQAVTGIISGLLITIITARSL